MSNPPGADVDLEPKNRPRQKRAIETYQRVLDVTAHLLETEGVERISTNLIAENAGITPPTLYRYFPNKYAVLRALGDRLMQVQKEAFDLFIEETKASFETQQAGGLKLLQNVLRVTQEHPGSLAIMRSMRAVPVLQQVRLASHHEMADEWTLILLPGLPNLPKKEVWIKARLNIEIGYAAIEMAMEEKKISTKAILNQAAEILTAHWRDVYSPS